MLQGRDLRPHVGRHVCPPLARGFPTVTVTPLSTVWQQTSRQFRLRSAGFRRAKRGPRTRERDGGICSECGTSCGGAEGLNGQKIKDTRAPLTGFGKFVVLLGVPKKVTNSRVNQLTAHLGFHSGGEKSCPRPPPEARLAWKLAGKTHSRPK